MKTTDPRKRALLESMKNGLIVSCQVQKDDPIYTEDMALKMAEAAKWAGAVGIRANSPEQIAQIAVVVGQHVQACFSAEKKVLEMIGTGEITAREQIDTYPWPRKN